MMMAIVKWRTMNKIVIRGNAIVKNCENLYIRWLRGVCAKKKHESVGVHINQQKNKKIKIQKEQLNRILTQKM